MTSEAEKNDVLATIAEALAATDPDHAEHIAHSVTAESWRVKVLVRIAETRSHRAGYDTELNR